MITLIVTLIGRIIALIMVIRVVLRDGIIKVKVDMLVNYPLLGSGLGDCGLCLGFRV